MKNIGIKVKNPKVKCEDKNCPFHGKISVRGRVFEGIVISDKAKNTATVQWEYFYYLPKYERYERRRTKISVHNPPCIDAKKGDLVKIAECRPISKTKSFVIIELIGDKK
ncbi:MAG: 30S ribosomal protein S17 [Candidatus Aenigmarchaeota archaeon]|nr:30S ribosomal protein S17 [Candidatus Aenigmarchaeota archaeon]